MASVIVDGRELPAPQSLVDRQANAVMPTRYVSVAVARQRLETAGKWDALVGALSMPLLIKIATLQQGLDPADQEVRAAITGVGADPNVILAI